MTKDEALKLALEALVFNQANWQGKDKAINAIKEALAQPEYQSTADKSKLEKVPAKGTLLAQPEQKPVALETVYETIIQWDEGGGKRSRRELARRIVSLYTTPPQRKPLTDEEVNKLVDDEDWYNDPYGFVRVIEAEHGIKGEA